MNLLQFFVVLILLVLLGLASYYAYTIIENKPFFPPPPETSPPSDPTVLKTPDLDSEAPGTCTFEGEDIGKVFDFKGKKIARDTKIPCSTCNQHIYKDKAGCVLFKYDFSENLNVEGSKMNEQDESGVCTASLGVSQKCPF